jgi:Ca2+-binding EF-hand superfamily protein
MAKKDLHRVYEIIDKDRDGLVNMDDIKNIANLTWKQTEEEEDPDCWLDEQDTLKGNDILVRQQLLDVYDEVKTKLENKNATLEQIFFNELQFSPHALATVKGLSTAMDKLGIVVSQVQAERMLKDLRKVQNGKFECTYKDFVDYMTRRRINVAFLEKGFIDPLLASCT